MQFPIQANSKILISFLHDLHPIHQDPALIILYLFNRSGRRPYVRFVHAVGAWLYALLNNLSLHASDVKWVIISRIAYFITITLLLPVSIKYGHSTYHYHFYCRVYCYCL